MDGEIGRQALVRNYFRSGIVIVLMLVLAMAFFVAGIFLPFTSMTKLWLFQNQISVYRGLIILWQAGELFLFLILFVFTICFPFVKLTAMLALWLYPRCGCRPRAKDVPLCVEHGQMVHARRFCGGHPGADNQIQRRRATSRWEMAFFCFLSPSCSHNLRRSGPARSSPGSRRDRPDLPAFDQRQFDFLREDIRSEWIR